MCFPIEANIVTHSLVKDIFQAIVYYYVGSEKWSFGWCFKDLLARNISFTRNIRWFRLLHDAYSDASHVPKQESTREKLTAGKRPRNDRSTSFLFHGGRALLFFFPSFLLFGFALWHSPLFLAVTRFDVMHREHNKFLFDEEG